MKTLAFTLPCLLLIDTDGALHARYETEGGTTLDKPKWYEEPHDAHGLDEVPTGSDWVKVSGGRTHAGSLATCGITTDGHIHCWGDTEDVDTGINNSWIPDEVPTSGGWVHITMSEDYACAIDVEGQVSCFGNYWPPSSLKYALDNLVSEPPTEDLGARHRWPEPRSGR